MKGFFLRRLLLFVPTLLGAVTLVFFLIHLIPGDPVEVMLGETASPADKESLRRQLGLHLPLWQQYLRYLSGLATGDLGQSLYHHGSVRDLILLRLPATLELSAAALGLALVLALPLGTVAAIRRGSWVDRFSLFISLFGLAIPNFWLGPVLIIAFSIELAWLPVSGRGTLANLVLPALTLGTGMAAILLRMVRSSLLEVIHEDYIQTARAKGVSEWSIWVKHALRNSLLPVITIAGLQFGALLAGSVITETIFNWPGLGRLTIQSIHTRDYPLAQGCILVIASTYLIVNLLTDVLYKLADPRITYAR